MYYQPKEAVPLHAEHRATMADVALDKPFYGYRKIVRELAKRGVVLTEKQTRTLMHRMGLRAIIPKKNTSKKHPEHPVYPYLLGGMQIRYPNQVWATDITYIKLPQIGYVYLVAIIDLYSRKVLTWRLSTSMDSWFCEEALLEAMVRYGVPSIFNTDQGSQFTSAAFVGILENHHVRVSMDGKGAWRDNIFVERLWKTVKYEDIHLNGYQDVRSLKKGLDQYFRFYNGDRYHQALDYETPNRRYESFQSREEVA